MAKKHDKNHQTFLLTLSDTLRAQTDVEAVGSRAVQLIADQLGADRVYLVSLNPDDDTVVVTHETRRQEMPPLRGTYRSSDFPAAIQEIFERTIVYTDVRTDARLTELDRLSFAGLGAVGFMAASLRRGSQTMIWAAGAVSSEPRSWTASEVVMFEDALERTWAAVERARAEAALRKSEEKYRWLFGTMDLGFSISEAIRDENGQLINYRLRELNPAFTKLTGLDPVEALGKTILELLPGLDPWWLTTYQRVLDTQETSHFEQFVPQLHRWYEITAFYYGKEQFAVYYSDITGRKRHEASLAFLAEVGQDLAGLTNIDETMTALGAKIAGYFKLAEVVFGEMSDDEQTVHISHEWHRADYPAVKGTYAIKAYYSPEFEALHRAGQIAVVRDTANDERVDAAGYAALGIGAFVNVPLMRQNKWLFNFTLVDANPRNWREDEIELMRELTTRIWTRLERARTEERLAESQRFVQGIITSLPLVIYLFDLVERKNLYLSPQIMAVFGYRPDEMQGSGTNLLPTFFHPDDLPPMGEYFEQITRSTDAQVFSTECRMHHKERGWIWVVCRDVVYARDGKGRPTQLLGTAEDISEQRANADALRESEKRFRLAIEATDLGTWEWDLETDEVYWNEQHFRLFGLEPKPNPIDPNAFFNHVHPDDRERIRARLQRTIEERAVYDEDFLAVLADGTTRWMSGYGRVVEEVAGKAVRLSGVMYDIDERKRAEQALQQADRRKDEFLAMLAHELRNPMSTLRSGLQILTLTDGKDQTSSDTIAMMNRQTDHLVRMVDDLLDVSRISQGKIELKKQRLNLVEVVAQAVESVQALYREQGRGLQIDLPSAQIEVEGDRDRLTQVVTNLLTNGARYTGEQGQVWLRLDHRRQEAILQVRDNGIGLAADQLLAIFELFVQVDNSLARSKGGLGIGLTLVKRLVELHGGRVAVQSGGLGQGSTFRVQLPTLAPAAEPTAIPAPPVQDPSAARRILVIDDNADAGFTLTMLLKLKGYEAHSRTSGRAGLEAAESLQPAAVLLDIGMPDLDGYATCELIRQQSWGQSMVVIALTGYGQAEDRQRTREAGFDGHLVKPVDLGELTKLLTNLLDKGSNF